MTHFAHTRPVARVPHLCDDCGRLIQPGETYRRGAALEGSTAWTYKECRHCLVLVAVFYDQGDPYDEYDWTVLQDLRDAYDWEPEALEVFDQYRREWTDEQGVLYPLPTYQAGDLRVGVAP